MAATTSLLLAFYGDDFTGSTDALEALTRAGLRTMLFVEPPTSKQLAELGHLDAIGIAGVTRSLGLDQLSSQLRGVLPALRALAPRHVHYKVCSTFDSSPRVGSIGRAIEVGVEIFPGGFVPLVVGAPGLGRYCLFGNLFARMGIGSAGEIYRLDRHPSMSRHPVTPADESDLRLHLARQTSKRIGLVDVLALDRPIAETRGALRQTVSGGAEIVLFDALTPLHLERIGALLEETAAANAGPLFSVGSSAIESALVQHWRAGNKLPAEPVWASPGEARPLLVICGSCSPVSTGQISWAVAHGFAEIVLDVGSLLASESATIEAAFAETRRALAAGRHVVLHTHANQQEISITPGQRATIGAALGSIAGQTIETVRVKRMLITGGDTSGYASTTLGITALEMIAPLAPGAPLCRAHAPGSPVHGMEINFKGGQVGAPDYFGAVAAGKI